MRFGPIDIVGAFVIEPERHVDERGSFARTFCVDELAAHGIHDDFPQGNLSHNTSRGTLRGLHYEVQPTNESKLVTCTHGEIHDVIVDVRPGSPTEGVVCAVHLTRDNGRTLYVPSGCAHGFLTLVDDVDVSYRMGARFRSDAGRGIRWDDPAFAIEWPFEPVVISERDATYPDYAG